MPIGMSGEKPDSRCLLRKLNRVHRLKISEGMQERKTYLASMGSNDVFQKLVFNFGLRSNIKRPVPEQCPFMFFRSGKRFAELHTIFRLSGGVT